MTRAYLSEEGAKAQAYQTWAIRHHLETDQRPPEEARCYVAFECNLLDPTSTVTVGKTTKRIRTLIDCGNAGVVVALLDANGPLATYAFCPEKIGEVCVYDRVKRRLAFMECTHFTRYADESASDVIASDDEEYDLTITA